MRVKQGNDTGLDQGGVYNYTDTGYDYSDNSTDFSYDNYTDYDYDYDYDNSSYDEGYWDEQGNWVSYDNSTYYDDVYGDDWEQHDEHHENHTEYHCPESSPWGMFEGQTEEDLGQFFERESEDATVDEWGNGYWIHEEEEEYAEGGFYTWEDETTGDYGFEGWAWDGSSSIYFWSENDGEISWEYYDCDWNLIESVHASHDTVEHHPDDNDAVRYLKDVYNEGNHYYWEDGAVEFWSTDYLTWGNVYPDGYIWADQYTSDWELEFELEAECFGASGSYDHWDWESADGEHSGTTEWDHDCETYSQYEELFEHSEEAWEAEAEADADASLLAQTARMQLRSHRR